MQKAINFNNVSTVSVKGSDYRIHLWYMSKDVAIKIMNNSNLNENLSEKTYYQKTKETISNRAKDYYENDKERLREQARHKHRELSKEEKNIMTVYGRSRYHNMSEEKRQ